MQIINRQPLLGLLLLALLAILQACTASRPPSDNLHSGQLTASADLVNHLNDAATQGDIASQIALAKIYDGYVEELRGLIHSLNWDRMPKESLLTRYGVLLEEFAREKLGKRIKVNSENEDGILHALSFIARYCWESSAQLLEKAAFAGNTEAQYLLSIKYHLGQGEKNSPKEDRYWIRKSAESGYPDAAALFVQRFRFGDEAANLDFQKAYKLLDKAKDSGSLSAYTEIGEMYKFGEITAFHIASRDEAMEWYKKAASLGDSRAMYELGNLLINCHDCKNRNEAEGKMWIKRAADAGYDAAEWVICNHYSMSDLEHGDIACTTILANKRNYFALRLIGIAYEHGWWGITPDLAEAYKWYSIAGSRAADLLLKEMTLREAQDGTERLTSWKIRYVMCLADECSPPAFEPARKRSTGGLVGPTQPIKTRVSKNPGQRGFSANIPAC